MSADMPPIEPEPNQLIVLVERAKWLAARIEAKKKVGWDIEWDEREREALEWAISYLIDMP